MILYVYTEISIEVLQLKKHGLLCQAITKIVLPLLDNNTRIRKEAVRHWQQQSTCTTLAIASTYRVLEVEMTI